MLHRGRAGRMRVMPGAGGSTRDPVSVPFDGSARDLLTRAYASPRQWVTVWLPDPTIRQRTRFLAAGLRVDGPDPLPKGGGVDAKTRWGRGFVRAVYYQHRHFSPVRAGAGWARRSSPRNTGGLRIEIGRHVPASPQFDPARPAAGGFPARRRVRLQLAAGGAAKAAAVRRLSNSDRIYTPAGAPAARWGGGNRFRDWA
jgi:hypothetical protein